MASTSGSSDGSGAAQEDPTLTLGETCSTLAGVPTGYPSNCHFTRSCRSCLQKSGCMIDPNGRCVDQSTSDRESLDFKLAAESNLVLPNATKTAESWRLGRPQYWQFPAFEAKYCSEEDPVCRSCVDEKFWAYVVPDSRYCVGQDGCVCIYDCEYRNYVNEVECVSEYNASFTAVPADERPTTSFNAIIATCLVVVLAVIGMLALSCLVHRSHRRRQQQFEEERWHPSRTPNFRPSSALGVSQLTLSGWLHHRQDLINKEQQHLGRTDVRGQGGIYLNAVQDQTSSTAPHSPRQLVVSTQALL